MAEMLLGGIWYLFARSRIHDERTEGSGAQAAIWIRLRLFSNSAAILHHFISQDG